MAYVPKDALRRKRELQLSAWDVYEALCEMANADTRIVLRKFFDDSRASKIFHSELMELTGGLALGTVKNALTELRIGRKDGKGRIVHGGGWIEVRGGRLCVLVGTFLREIRKPKNPSPADDTPSPAGYRTSLTDEDGSLITDGSSPCSDGANKGTRAPSDPTMSQPPNQPHTQARVASSAPEAPAARLSAPQTERATTCTDGELWRYADANGLRGGWVTVAKRTGEHDFAVRRFLANPQAHSPPAQVDLGGSKVERSMTVINTLLEELEEKRRAKGA